jgi:hypothetical protein
MSSLRLAVSAVLVASLSAAVFAYFVTPSPPPQVDADQRLLPAAPDLKDHPDPAVSTNIDRGLSADELAAEAFDRAAKAILKRMPDARASAGTDEPRITGHIPLPKSRPIPRL